MSAENPDALPPAAAEYAASLTSDPARRRVFDQLRILMPTPESRLARLYEAGRLLLALRPVPNYGTHWIEILAEHAEVDRSFLYKLLRFAEAYTAEQVESLAMAGVCWSLVDAVLKLEDTEAASELLLRAVDDEWSVRDLQLHLRQQNPLAELRRGRTAVTPESHGLEVDIREALRPAEEVIRLHQAVWDVPPEELALRSLTEMANAARAQATYAAGRFRLAAANLAAMADGLDAVAGQINVDQSTPSPG